MFRPPLKPLRFADLKGILAQTRKTEEPLYQVVQEIIERLDKVQFELVPKNPGGGGGGLPPPGNGGGGGDDFASKDATYLTVNSEGATLPNSRRFSSADGNHISVDTTTPGLYLINTGPDIPLLDAGNVWTERQIYIHPQPALFFEETDQPANFRWWEIVVNDQIMFFFALDDGGASIGTPLELRRTGDARIERRLAITTLNPLYELDVRNSTGISQIHFTGLDLDDGGYLTSAGGSTANLSGGAAWNGSAWIAKSTLAEIISLNAQGITFWSNTGLVPGNTFAPNHRMRIAHDGKVGIGTLTPGNDLTVSRSGVPATISVRGHGSAPTSDTGTLATFRSRGNEAAPAAVQNGDYVGQLSYIAHDGTSFSESAGIIAIIQGTVATGRRPTRLSFMVSPDNVNTNYEAMRIEPNGILMLTIGQIQFPITQVQSTNPNILDDYREGTWTPAFGGDGGQSGQVYASQVGNYVKVGKKVTCWFLIRLSTLGTITGAVIITGFPFTTAPVAVGAFGGQSISWNGIVTPYVHMECSMVVNSTFAYITAITGAQTSSAGSTITGANLGNIGEVRGCVTYFTAN